MPLYLSLPNHAAIQYIENNNTILEKEYKETIVKFFPEAAIITNETPKTVVDFSQESLEEIFGSCVTDWTIVGMYYEAGSPFQVQKLKTRSDYMQGEPCDVVGSLSDLLSSTRLASGSCLRVHNIPMALSVYDPPLFLATDLKGWGKTLDHPFCKCSVPFPRLRTRWGNVATAGTFTDWISPENGECTFLNILSGAQYIIIALPSSHAPRPPITTPSVDNDDWDFEGVLLEEGMNM